MSLTLPFNGLLAKYLFSQQAGTKAKMKRFILEFKLYLQVVLTITPKPVLDVAFLKYEILLAIVFSVTEVVQFWEEDIATSNI